MAVPVFSIGPVDQNVVYAFIAGFIISMLIFGIRILVIKSRTKKTIKDLKSSMISRIDLEAESIERMKREIESLRQSNKNLQVSVNNLSQKPGRREHLQLKIYQEAVEKMSVRAPGFAPAWQIVLRECEEEAGKSLDGTKPFSRRLVSSSGSGWRSSSHNSSSGTEGSSENFNADSDIPGKSLSSEDPGKNGGLFQRFFGKK